MRFTDTLIGGVVVVDPEPLSDDRGHFARTFSGRDFARLGLDPHVSQCNTSFNARAGTLRGMHFQAQPHGEAKLVRCTRGAIFDVAVDLRPASPAFRRWFGVELTQENGRQLHIPAGVAHGFQTLEDASEVFYLMSHEYVPGAGRGVRWDDPAFGIEWPAAPPGGRVISERDASYRDVAP
jgi:dTDP-4-dehydrorhamnose 3,5-epimerase